MTAAEYWDGDCTLTRAYQEAAEIKRDMENQQAWLAGIYTLAALKNALSSAFGNGRNVAQYPDRPIPLNEKQSEEQREAKENEQMKKALEMFKLSMAANNSKAGKAGDDSGR